MSVKAWVLPGRASSEERVEGTGWTTLTVGMAATAVWFSRALLGGGARHEAEDDDCDEDDCDDQYADPHAAAECPAQAAEGRMSDDLSRRRVWSCRC